ncbi:MAG: extracellular solute-binding protein [Alphaproteobacteria bacterium]|nr:extracellular solute-binding protein [Alphaproteobacteria bacterium]
MKRPIIGVAAAAGLLLFAGPAAAEGELNIFNWGNYTNPKLIEKFEQTHHVKVTLSDYDSNDSMLAKIKAGGHGYDIVVPSDYMVKIMIGEGLLLETRPNQMSNFKNLSKQWAGVYFDEGRNYSVPWQWGTTGVTVNTKTYGGDINTWAMVFDPPEELKGKINVVPEMNDVMNAALFYKGFPYCNSNREQLKEVSDMLVAAKKDWLSMEYGNVERFGKEDIHAGVNWNGASMRARLSNPAVAYGYPKEGIGTWMDNVVVLKDAKNIENAKLFQNFIMDPENAAMISDFAKYANAIDGSEKFLPAEFAQAPEIKAPSWYKPVFVPPCPQEVNELYTKIWTNLMK